MNYCEYEQQSILLYTYVVNQLEQLLAKQSIDPSSKENDVEEAEVEDLVQSENEVDEESECEEADEDTESEEEMDTEESPGYCKVTNIMHPIHIKLGAHSTIWVT
jgi:uncharacterized membrane protein YukC